MEYRGKDRKSLKPDKWLNFSTNLRPEGQPAWVTKVMRDALADTRYYSGWALTAARKGLAVYAGVSEDCVLPTAGGLAAIDLALSLRRGTVYTLPATFGEYKMRADIYARKTAFWRKACAPGDTVLFCNPNDPAGNALSREAVLEIFDETTAQGGELIVDEAFIDFCPEHSVRGDVQPGLTVVGSLSRTLCIPGERLGYICADPETIEYLERQALPWTVGTLASAVAAQLPEHLEQIRQDAAANSLRREALARRLTEMGAKVSPSQTNFLLVDFFQDMRPIEAALRQSGILVRNCASYGLPDSFVRLTVRTPEENDCLLEHLERLLRAR